MNDLKHYADLETHARKLLAMHDDRVRFLEMQRVSLLEYLFGTHADELRQAQISRSYAWERWQAAQRNLALAERRMHLEAGER